MPKASKPSTKARLLQASIQEFSAHGFRGASLRDIAKLAGTNVAAVKYHYDSKEKLWQSAVSHLYGALGEAILNDEERYTTDSTREVIRNSTRNYILFSAQNPELYRITLFEMIEGGERFEWLAKYQLREFMERSMAWTSIAQQGDVLPKDISPLNLVYVTMGAIQTIFMMAPQIDRSFKVDVFADEQIEQHIEAVFALLNL